MDKGKGRVKEIGKGKGGKGKMTRREKGVDEKGTGCPSPSFR